MAIGSEQVVVAICDACKKRTYAEPGNAPAVLTGVVDDNTRDEIQGIEWSACAPGHVGGAVKAVLQEARDKRRQALGKTSRPYSPPPSSSITTGNGVPTTAGASG